MNSEAFNLMAVKLEAAKREHIALLEREIYGSVASRPLSEIFRLTWRDRLARRLARISGYFSTLWMALRGVDLVEPYED